MNPGLSDSSPTLSPRHCPSVQLSGLDPERLGREVALAERDLATQQSNHGQLAQLGGRGVTSPSPGVEGWELPFVVSQGGQGASPWEHPEIRQPSAPAVLNGILEQANNGHALDKLMAS